jgi:AraC-like DNA-binding protein
MDDRTQRLADCIYGGQAVGDDEVLALLAPLGPPPWRVVALQYAPAERPPAAWRNRARAWLWLFLHPGLGYLVYRGESPLPRLPLPPSVLVGETRAAAAPSGLVAAIQDAVMSLRRRDLAELARRHGAPPGAAHERETRAVALARLRTGEAWAEALDCWIDTVLLRHQGTVHNLQRKLVEFLCLATVENDGDKPVSRTLRSAVQRVLANWALTSLMARFRADVAALVPLLRRQDGTVALPAAVQAAVAFAEREYARPVTLRHAAHAAGVSAAHLARSVRAHLGCTFTDHLTTLRLARAKELLATTDLPVAAVAARCGFAATEHFHRVFRRRMGTTPGAFRAR